MDLTEEELKRFRRKKNFLERLAEPRVTSKPSLDENARFNNERKYPRVGPDYFGRFLSSQFVVEGLDDLKEISSLAERYSSISEGNESIASNEGSLDWMRIKDPKGKRRMNQKWRRFLTSSLGSERAAALVGSDSDSDGSSADGSSDENSDEAEADMWTGWKWEEFPSDKIGTTEKNRIMVYWTSSRYEGQWNKDFNVPHGLGMYTMPHGVTYVGGMHDGRFHGKGVLRYPNGAMVEGVWNHGCIQKRRITFPDGLRYKEKDWDYCSPPDRRFHIERLYGLRPAGRSHLTQQYPTRRIPAGCYDTGDGYYNHRTRCVYSADTRKVLRIPTNKEAEWIMKNCRKGWDENVNYEPDIFADVRTEKDLETMVRRRIIRKSKLIEEDRRKSYLDDRTGRGSQDEHRDVADDHSQSESASRGQSEEQAQSEAPEYEIPLSVVEDSLEGPREDQSDHKSDNKEFMTKLIEDLKFWVIEGNESDEYSNEAEIAIYSADFDE